MPIFQFWAWILQFFSYVIFKSFNFLMKKSSQLIFAALYFYIHELKKCLIFKTLFQTGYINIFLLRAVFFSRHVQLKNLLF